MTPQNRPSGEMDSDVGSPCVAMTNTPASANSNPATSRALGPRRNRTQVMTMMMTRPICWMTVAVPALVFKMASK